VRERGRERERRERERERKKHSKLATNWHPQATKVKSYRAYRGIPAHVVRTRRPTSVRRWLTEGRKSGAGPTSAARTCAGGRYGKGEEWKGVEKEEDYEEKIRDTISESTGAGRTQGKK
jgi:hypothetical protein